MEDEALSCLPLVQGWCQWGPPEARARQKSSGHRLKSSGTRWAHTSLLALNVHALGTSASGATGSHTLCSVLFPILLGTFQPESTPRFLQLKHRGAMQGQLPSWTPGAATSGTNTAKRPGSRAAGQCTSLGWTREHGGRVPRPEGLRPTVPVPSSPRKP